MPIFPLLFKINNELPNVKLLLLKLILKLLRVIAPLKIKFEFIFKELFKLKFPELLIIKQLLGADG